jgi:hypothetical protein
MAAFRRCILALAVLAVFASLASAQTPTPMTCNLTATPGTIRTESATDLVGDLVVTCTGGRVPTSVTIGSQIPVANFVITLPATVTSRLTQTTGSVSDALLVIDDPQGATGLGGFGQGALPSVCLNANVPAGCAAFFNEITVGGQPTPVASSTVAATTNAANVYQGVVSGSQVTFFGVPVLPPDTSGFARTFRITNVRINGAGLTGALSASLSLSGNGANLISLSSAQVTVASATSGMTTSVTPTTGASLIVCTTGTLVGAGTINFAENFGTGFRTRTTVTASTPAGAYGLQTNSIVQNVPGTSYSGSESGLEIALGGAPNTVATAGLADFGTRLKAVFNNIPSGVRLFVSFTNTVNGAWTNFGTAAGANITSSYAQLISAVSGETAVGSAGSLLATPTLTTTATGPGLAVGFPYVEITPTSGSTATAVWEVVNTIPGQNETLSFNVYATYTANVPTPGSVCSNGGGGIDVDSALYGHLDRQDPGHIYAMPDHSSLSVPD